MYGEVLHSKLSYYLEKEILYLVQKFGFGSKLGITAKAKRQTFLIENGKFKKIWKKVTVKSHAKDVLAAL